MAAPFVGERSEQFHRKGDQLVKNRSLLSGQMLERMQDARQLKAALVDPHDPEAQYGKILHAYDFMRALQTIVPGAYLKPAGKKAALYCVRFMDQDVEICGGGFPHLPEWSILEPFYEEFPTISNKVVEADDGGIPTEVFTPEMDPFQRVHTSSIEVVRGWRTILARYIIPGYTNETAAEQLFGLTDRASWAALMGHLKDARQIIH